MTDMAAGSTAARTLQQNVYGGQFDQANIAAAAEENQLKLQQDRIKTSYAPEEAALKLQQDQATVQKSKLANLIAETGYKSSQDSKQKIATIISTDDFKKADSVKRLQMLGAAEMESGRVEEGAKLIAGAEALELKETQTKLKQQEANALTVGNAYAVVKALKTPEQQANFFNEMKSQKPEEYQSLVNQIGPSTFEKMSPKEKTEALGYLMQVTGNKNLLATNETRLQLADIQKQIQAAHDTLKETIAKNKTAKGGDPTELREYNAYNRATYRIDSEYRKPLQEATDVFKKAMEEDSKKTGLFSAFTGGSSAIEDAKTLEKQQQLKSTKAWKALQEIRQESIQKKLDAVEGLPEGKEKDRLFKLLNQQLELTQEDLPPKKGAAKPPSEDKPKEAPAKPSATSNKYTVDNPAKPTTQKEYDQLPAGSYYLKDGQTYKKGK